MAAASFTFAAALAYPPDVGVAPCELPVNFAGQFESENKFTLKLAGAGTKAVNFGTVAPNGAKLLLVEYDPDPSPAAQPVQLQFNGGGADGQLELTQGGFLAYGSSAPTTAGILSMSVVHAANAVLRVTILG
jgi:hypothetical protein